MQYVLSSKPINTQCRYASSHTTSWLYTTKPSNVCASRTRLDDQTQILSQAPLPSGGGALFYAFSEQIMNSLEAGLQPIRRFASGDAAKKRRSHICCSHAAIFTAAK